MRALEERKKALDEERGDIEAKLAGLDSALVVLEQTYRVTNSPRGLDALREQMEPADGMTERIRKILTACPRREFTPVEVRDVLGATGFDVKDRSNAMAEIHTVLKRIEQADPRVASLKNSEGNTVYVYNPNVRERKMATVSR